MEITIKIDGRMVSVEVSAEVAECLDVGNHKAANLSHEKRRHWDDREFDEYIIAAEGRLPYMASPEEQVCQWETWDEIMAVLALCTEAQRERFLLHGSTGWRKSRLRPFLWTVTTKTSTGSTNSPSTSGREGKSDISGPMCSI